MKWLAEQKVTIELEADTEDEAKKMIKTNKLNCSDGKISIIRQSQQSWLLPQSTFDEYDLSYIINS